MPLLKKHSPILFFLLCLSPSCMRSMQHPHLQEQLNADRLQNDREHFRSYFNLSMPIQPEVLQKQIEDFNDRMKKSNILARASQIEETFYIEFYIKNSSGANIKIHVTNMPRGSDSAIPEHVCKAQLKRRFEGQLEDHVEKIAKTTKREAKKKFNNCWKTFFYFRVAPRIALSVSESIGEDLAHDIVEALPFSFSQTTDYTQTIQDLHALKNESLAAEQGFKETKELSDAAAILNQLIQNAAPEQKEKMDDIKKRFRKEFCKAYEQSLNQ